MPVKKESLKKTYSVPEPLAKQVELAAARAPDITQSDIVREALEHHFQGDLAEALTDTVRQQISLLAAQVHTDLAAVTSALQGSRDAFAAHLKKLESRLTSLEACLERLERQQQQAESTRADQWQQVQEAFDHLRAQVTHLTPTRSPKRWPW